MQDTWGAQIEGEEALSEFSWQTSQNNGLVPFITEKSCSTFSAIHARAVLYLWLQGKSCFAFLPVSENVAEAACEGVVIFYQEPLGLKGKKIRHCTKFVNIYVP